MLSQRTHHQGDIGPARQYGPINLEGPSSAHIGDSYQYQQIHHHHHPAAGNACFSLYTSNELPTARHTIQLAAHLLLHIAVAKYFS